MESSTSHNLQQHHQSANDLRTAVTQSSTSNADTGSITHLDGNPPQDIHINIQELAKKFRPFVVPPAPVPMESVDESTLKAQRVYRERRRTTQKSYTATLTITETTHPNRRKTYKVRASPIHEENAALMDTPPPLRQPFLNRMRERQRRLEEWRENGPAKDMWRAISVKRQRKLKMKKHKYKKLMRRTRNLRRKLDRN